MVLHIDTLSRWVATVQPIKGPYAELHTPDQDVRLLAYSNFFQTLTTG